MAPGDKTGHRLANLEFLRAACALVVMLNHVYCEGADVPQYAPIVAIASYSVEAVMGFFVLSGCVISLQDYHDTGRYFRSRLLRIMPIYYAVLALSIALMVACGSRFGPWQLGANTLFLQTLDWEPLNPLRFFVPSWSLSYEIFYYAAFIAILVVPRLLLPLLLAALAVGTGLYFMGQPAPVVVWPLHAFSFFAMWLAGVLITRLVRSGHAVSIGTGALMMAVGAALAHVPLSTPAKFDFFRLAGFAMGFAVLVWALLSNAIPAGRRTLLDFGLAARLAIAGATIALLWWHSESHLTAKLALTVVLVLFAALPDRLAAGVAFVARPALPFMVYIAGLSYALYLVHYPLVQTFNVLHPFPPIVDLAAVVVLSLGLAHLLDYRLQPWVRGRLNRNQPAAATSTRSSMRM